LDHPAHPQNILGTLEGPVRKTNIFIDETLVSIVKGLNIPVVTDTYDDPYLSCCLTHHQGYEKTSIGSKYDIHQFLRISCIENNNNIHPFQFTIDTLDPNNLHEDNISSIWDVPTIQKWNEVMDGIACRRYWADPSRLPAHHRVLARRSEMLATKLRENTLLLSLQKWAHKPFQKVLEIIPDLIKMLVYPLTTLLHWMHDPYTIRDLLYPEAVYQEVIGHEILTWGYLNSLDTSRIVFPYTNGQNLLNKIHLINSDDVTIPNPHFFLILNFHILKSNNNRTWSNTSLSFFDEFGSNFFDSVFPVQSNPDYPDETETH
ncbi:hypothetical protein PAXRUDRAFT_150342, partial [Paxillus rubicundulus Ve08.2h10]